MAFFTLGIFASIHAFYDDRHYLVSLSGVLHALAIAAYPTLLLVVALFPAFFCVANKHDCLKRVLWYFLSAMVCGAILLAAFGVSPGDLWYCYKGVSESNVHFEAKTSLGGIGRSVLDWLPRFPGLVVGIFALAVFAWGF